MKNKIIFTIFIALGFIFFTNFKISADVVSSENGLFNVQVGEDGYVRPSYNRASLEFPGESADSFVRSFPVEVNAGLDNTGPDLPTDPIYLWKHTMCFVVEDVETECEVDEVTINSLRSYSIEAETNYSFWADKEKIPFFKITEKQSIIVTFKNEFTCKENCDTGNFILDDITLIVDDGPVLLLEESSFPDEEITYDSPIDLKITFFDILGLEEDSLKYAWQSVLDYNNVNTPFENGVGFTSRPPEFLSRGVESFYLVVTAKDIKGYSSAMFYNFNFKSEGSINLGEDSILPSSELFYNKLHFNVKNDNFINYKYRILTSYTNYFINIDDINIEFSADTDIYVSTLTNNSYHLYITFEDELGNKYGNVYEFKIDITLPTIRTNTFPDNNPVYNEVRGKIDFVDNRSGINNDKLFYLFSSASVDLDNDYELINIPYLNNSELVSLEGIDGTWYLYFLVYDNADNFQIFILEYKFDNTPPVLSEERSKNDPSLKASDHAVYINISDLSGLESSSFLCGWFLNGEGVTNYYTLNDTCLNKTFIGTPEGLEGEYFLWIYASDIVGNFAYLRSDNMYSIDTKKPKLTYEVVNDHLEYAEINQVFVSFIDVYSDIDETSFKYKWIPSSVTPSSSNELELSFNNESYINYPFNYYGEFKLWLSAKDNLGNEYFAPLGEVFRIDTGIITLEVEGNETIKIIRGEKFTIPGANAYKGESLYNGRVVDFSVNTDLELSKTGTYIIKYTSGEGPNKVVVIRTVVVEESIYLVIILLITFISGLTIFVYQLIRKRRLN